MFVLSGSAKYIATCAASVTPRAAATRVGRGHSPPRTTAATTSTASAPSEMVAAPSGRPHARNSTKRSNRSPGPGFARIQLPSACAHVSSTNAAAATPAGTSGAIDRTHGARPRSPA